MIENRIRHLEEQHNVLDKKIDGLESTGKFDDDQIHNLKKQRLHVRDELSRLRKEQYDRSQTVTWDE